MVLSNNTTHKFQFKSNFSFQCFAGKLLFLFDNNKIRGVATCTHGRTCVPEKIGSLRNDYGHAYGYGNKYATKQYGLMRKPMACTCVMTSGTYTFICRTPQNNNVKLMTKFKFYRVRGTRDGDLLILCLNLNVIPTNYVPIYR